jgi:putative ABC transport system ATP-binding protein
MAIIEVRNLTKQFGVGDVAVEVLKGVNLTIQVGEFVALMGPSGSGKSTLMNIIGGIEPPTSGQILLDGVDIGRLDDDARTLMRRRKIGFIFQAFNLIPTLIAIGWGFLQAGEGASGDCVRAGGDVSSGGSHSE